MYEDYINTFYDGNQKSGSGRQEFVGLKGPELSEDLKDPEITGDPELVQDLVDFREKWEFSSKAKEKIIKTVNKIKVNLEKDGDGESGLIEFKLGTKSYKILDPILNMHSDADYLDDYDGKFRKINGKVVYGVNSLGMLGNDVDLWDNQELKKYVKDKYREGLHIPSMEEMKNLMRQLGQDAGLSAEKDQIEMFIYLTGMEGTYWLSGHKGSFRDLLRCDRYCCRFGNNEGLENLCMIAVD